MANCAIFEKGSDRITYFIRDCIQSGRDFRGSNMSVTGVKEHLFDTLWTDDDGEQGGSVKALTEAKRYQGRVVSNEDDVDRVTRELIREKYPVEEEMKVLRLKLSGDDTGWEDYREFAEQIVGDGRAVKMSLTRSK